MTPTLIACSHGTSSHEGRAAISALVEQVRALLPGVRVEEAFVDVQQPEVADVVERAVAGADGHPAGGAVVVPLLLSTGYHTKVDIARAVAAHPGAAVAAPTLGPHDALVDVLLDRLAAAGEFDAVVLAAAGSSDPSAAVDVEAMARLLAERLRAQRRSAQRPAAQRPAIERPAAQRPPAPVTVGFASGAGVRIPAAVEAARAAGARRVAIASYVLAPGYFADVIARSGADVVTAPLAPDARLAGIVVERFAAASLALAGQSPFTLTI